MFQADNNMEYVIEAADVDDMKSWLATIKYCMRSPPTSQPPPDALPGAPEPAPPDLPPRRDLPTSTSNADLTTDTPEETELGGALFSTLLLLHLSLLTLNLTISCVFGHGKYDPNI